MWRCRSLIAAMIVSSIPWVARSEEHTSELQSQSNLVCRLLLEKKNTESADGVVVSIHGYTFRHSAAPDSVITRQRNSVIVVSGTLIADMTHAIFLTAIVVDRVG